MARAARNGRHPAFLSLLAVLALLSAASPAGSDEGKIAIIVDGLPLDAKAIAVKDDVYVPAWILENYARTKVNWVRRSNILEIITTSPDQAVPPPEGTRSVRRG